MIPWLKDSITNAGVQIEIEILDLRNYFGEKGKLEQKLSEYGGCWVRGGNVYILQKAMEKSGFDQILKEWFG